ncbi:MAG TPA: hypothetical protein VIL21_00670 [Solirubrobacterales bacterium]|jgi:hypothetical protein
MKLRTLSATFLAAVLTLWICAAPASATIVTFPEGGIYEGPITAVSGQTELHGAAGTITCETSTLEATIEEQGESVTAQGKVSTLDFSECSSSVTVLNAGSLEFHNTSGGNGTITSTGTEITFDGPLVACLYKTNSTDIGTLTGSLTTVGNAVVDLDSALLPRTGHSIFCGSNAEWTGSYTVTTPSTLTLEAAGKDVEGHFVSTETANADLIGTEDETHKLEWQIDGFGNGIVCDESKWKSSQGILTRRTMDFRPTFGECHTTGSSENFAIKTNECEFIFNVAKGTGDTTGQTASLFCQGKPIQIEHPKCTFSIPRLDGLEGIKYTKITLNKKHALTFDFNVKLKLAFAGKDCGGAENTGWLKGSLIVEAIDHKTELPAHITAT